LYARNVGFLILYRYRLIFDLTYILSISQTRITTPGYVDVPDPRRRFGKSDPVPKFIAF
jgi:hypothetical protein